MAQTETLREFLVKLGFQTDEPALKKFEDGIGKATKGVLALSVAVTAMATTVAIGVERFAARLEGLYYSAQRVGTTVQNLTAFQRATQSFGVSAEEAQVAVEAFATAMLNPALKGGIAGLLAGEGYKLGPDIITNLLNFLKILQTLPPIFQQQRLAQFGLPNDLAFLQLILKQPQLLALYQQFQPKSTGADKTAADAVKFMTSLRLFNAEVQKFGLQIYDLFEKKLGLSLDKMTAWLDKNGQRIANELVAGVKQLWDWIENQLIPTLKKWYAEWEKLNTRFDGWPNKIALVIGALKLFGGADVLGGVLSLTGGVLNLGAALLRVGTGATLALGLITRLSLVAGAAFLAYEAFKAYKETQELPPGVTTPAAKGVEGFLADLLPESLGIRQKFLDTVQANDARRAALYGPSGTAPAPIATAAANAAAISAPAVDQLNRPLTPAAAALAALAGVSERGGSGGTTINQNITFNIDGSKSPEATARAVQRSYQDMTHNTLQAAGGR